VKQIPGEVDLAVVVVPADMVLKIVDQCGWKRLSGLVIITAGFGETGPEGKERQRLLREKVFSCGMRCIGPNCLGILSTDAQVNLTATFGPSTRPGERPASAPTAARSAWPFLIM
jgi:acyl-CoA synthetase (NDP forming)